MSIISEFVLGLPKQLADTVSKLLRWQIRLSLPVVIVSGIFGMPSWHAPVSALLGALVGIVPALVYVRIAYRKPRGAPGKLLSAHFAAEAAKLAVTGLMFALVLALYKDVVPLALFSSFFATLVAYWIALLSK